MVKKYVTWNRHKLSDMQYIHPTYSIMNSGLVNSFVELEYTDGDKYLGIVDVSSDEILNVVIDMFKIFSLSFITEQQALSLCKSWYGDYFELDKDGFNIIDNRKEEDF